MASLTTTADPALPIPAPPIPAPPTPALPISGLPGPDPVDGAPRPSGSVAQTLNAAAVIVLAIYFGRDLLIPMVLAVLLAFVLAPAVTMLQRARLGYGPSVMVAVVLAFGVICGIGAVVGIQAANLAAELPKYQVTIQAKAKSLSVGSEMVARLAVAARRLLNGGSGDEAAAPAAPAAAAEQPSALAVLRTVLQPLLSPLATAGIVVVFVIFVLLYREDLRDRLVRLVGRRDLHRTILAMNDAARRLSRYFLIQLSLNVGFGAYVAGALWLCGLPNPLLWGILAATMRFVPFVGSAIALVPPLLLALAVAPGWGLALMTLAVILGGDLMMGQVIEPLTYGHSTGLSPVAVILSTAFWAFMWGPIGLLLATPLTVCLVVVGRHVDTLSFMHVLLGNASPLEPAETFYQRALEGNQARLVAQARVEAARSGLVTYFDQVALRGLVLAQADLSRDALAFERLEAIHGQIEALLATLRAQAVPAEAGPVPPRFAAAGTVLCIPGRGQFDDLAASMATQALLANGFGARAMANSELGSRVSATMAPDAVRLCCISALNEGSSAASIRFFLKRIQRLMPNAAVVVCLWHATAGSATLAMLRSEGGEEFIILSLGELVALATTLATRDEADARQRAGHPAAVGGVDAR